MTTTVRLSDPAPAGRVQNLRQVHTDAQFLSSHIEQHAHRVDEAMNLGRSQARDYFGRSVPELSRQVADIRDRFTALGVPDSDPVVARLDAALQRMDAMGEHGVDAARSPYFRGLSWGWGTRNMLPVAKALGEVDGKVIDTAPEHETVTW